MASKGWITREEWQYIKDLFANSWNFEEIVKQTGRSGETIKRIFESKSFKGYRSKVKQAHALWLGNKRQSNKTSDSLIMPSNPELKFRIFPGDRVREDNLGIVGYVNMSAITYESRKQILIEWFNDEGFLQSAWFDENRLRKVD